MSSLAAALGGFGLKRFFDLADSMDDGNNQ
jgi:hypothetical protein